MSAVISADSHVQEPPELYEERLAKRFRHRAPRIEVRPDGSRYRLVDGRRPRRLDIAEARETEGEKKHMWIRPRLDLEPSEYFARQGHVTFSDDPPALRNLESTGAGVLLWGSDYPHDEGTFPESQAVIRRIFRDVSKADERAITFDNAARLYGL